MKIQDFIHLNRLSNYDSVFFQNNLPGFKKAAKEVSHEERKRVHQTLLKVWDMFFIMQEPFDMAFEMAGIFFDLGYYDNALQFFNHSIRLFGETEDVMFNKGLVLYQLRRDAELLTLISSIKVMHPHFLRVADLENLEM